MRHIPLICACADRQPLLRTPCARLTSRQTLPTGAEREWRDHLVVYNSLFIGSPPPPAVPVQTVPPRAAGLQAAPAGEGGAQEPGVRRGRRGLLGRAGPAGRREKAV